MQVVQMLSFYILALACTLFFDGIRTWQVPGKHRHLSDDLHSHSGFEWGCTLSIIAPEDHLVKTREPQAS